MELPPIEQINVQNDLDTLDFADRQVKRYEEILGKLATQDARMPILAQLPGISLITGISLLAAIGEIERFPSAKKLVGYAGLGARVSQSGTSYRTGAITKTGRKDLRHVMVEWLDLPPAPIPAGRLNSSAWPRASARKGYRGHCPQDVGGGLAPTHQARS